MPIQELSIRTIMDWQEDIKSDLWVFPWGMKRNGIAGKNSVEWTSKYGSVITAAYNIGSSDGMNEKGLVANLLYLAGTLPFPFFESVCDNGCLSRYNHHDCIVYFSGLTCHPPKYYSFTFRIVKLEIDQYLHIFPIQKNTDYFLSNKTINS